jgi:hypothetical protein
VFLTGPTISLSPQPIPKRLCFRPTPNHVLARIVSGILIKAPHIILLQCPHEEYPTTTQPFSSIQRATGDDLPQFEKLLPIRKLFSLGIRRIEPVGSLAPAIKVPSIDPCETAGVISVKEQQCGDHDAVTKQGKVGKQNTVRVSVPSNPVCLSKHIRAD